MIRSFLRPLTCSAWFCCSVILVACAGADARSGSDVADPHAGSSSGEPGGGPQAGSASLPSAGAPAAIGGTAGAASGGAGPDLSYAGNGDSGGAGASGTGPAGNGGEAGVALPPSGPVHAIISGTTWLDDHGEPVNAHGGGLHREGGIFYMYGGYYAGRTNDFKAFAMYSSPDLMNWKFENKILTTQASGPLGPHRVGERPHIIQCVTGEYVLFAHAADMTYQKDKEVVYATSATINGSYTFRGILTNASGTQINHGDMTAFRSGDKSYVLTESGGTYELAADCHSFVKLTTAGAISGKESPTLFDIGSTYYWLWSNKTGFTSNDNSYATASAVDGTWTNQALLAPAGTKTWDSQSTAVLAVKGSEGTTYVYWGDRWNASDNSKATYVWQPLIVTDGNLSMPKFLPSWKIDVAKGTWTP